MFGLVALLALMGAGIIASFAGSLADRLAEEAGTEIDGTVGDDTIAGSDGREFIQGFAGNDVISGLGGEDLLVGGEGNKFIKGGGGADSLWGEAGDDTLHGNDGNYFLDGGAGAAAGEQVVAVNG